MCGEHPLWYQLGRGRVGGLGRERASGRRRPGSLKSVRSVSRAPALRRGRLLRTSTPKTRSRMEDAAHMARRLPDERQRPWRGRWQAKALVVAALVALTWALLPSSIGYPPSSPGTDTSLDRQSVVALLAPPLGGGFGTTRLDWSWDIDTKGDSTPKLFAIINSRVASGALVFGGPISESVADCYVNGVEAQPSAGMPVGLGFAIPKEVTFWLDGREDGTISRIDFHGDPGPGGTVIRCAADGFSSDSPPLHRTYSPELLAYVAGSESAPSEQLRQRRVCTSAEDLSEIRAEDECASEDQPVAYSYQKSTLTSRPEEEGIRDARLAIVGAAAGAVAAFILEIAPLAAPALLVALAWVRRQRREHLGRHPVDEG